MNVKLYSFLILTLIQVISLNVIFIDKYKKYHNYFIFIGLLSIIIEFLLFYNLLSYSYGEDLIEYAKWFQSTVHIYNINDISFDSKDVGFTYILYGLSFFTSDTSMFFFILSIYILIFLSVYVYLFMPKEKRKKYLYYLFLFFVIILLNRFFLGNVANTIRAFISATLFLLLVYFLYKKQYYVLLLIPFIYLIHKLQFVLFSLILLLSYFIPFKFLRIILIAAIINLFFGYTTQFLTNFIMSNMKELHEIYSSTILANIKLSNSLLFQHIILIVIPLSILLKNIKFKDYISLDHFQQILVKYTLLIFSVTYFFIEVTPRATRLLPVGFILLNLLITIYSTHKEKQIYVNVLLFVNYIAIYRHLGDLVI
jgi:hypothetical protein